MASTTSPKSISPKQPGERLDYDFDFTKWLADNGNDRLIEATVVCGDLSLTLETTVVDAYVVKQWVSGGTNGVKYKLTCYAVTAGGRHPEREMYIPVKET